jgi:hypothetical protein
MDWTPISDRALCELLLGAEARMTPPQAKLWGCIRITPQKWRESIYGTVGGGFWAVGLIGPTVIWYNDIEDGFNQSSYSTFGKMDEYRCNQDRLEWTVQHVLDRVEFGENPAPRRGPTIKTT